LGSKRDKIRIERLSKHRDSLRAIGRWFEEEWPTYYGPGGKGDVEHDVPAYAGGDALPVGIVALCNNERRGVAALKAESIASSSRHGLAPTMCGRRFAVAVSVRRCAPGWNKSLASLASSMPTVRRVLPRACSSATRGTLSSA